MRGWLDAQIMKARRSRVDTTPEALYQSWPRPLRVGMVRIGNIKVSQDSQGRTTIYYAQGTREGTIREIPPKDQQAIDDAWNEVKAARRKVDAVMKRAYKRARPYTAEELVRLGAEDRRPRA